MGILALQREQGYMYLKRTFYNAEIEYAYLDENKYK